MPQQTILIVDDERKNLLIMESLLSELGEAHRTICVSSGAEAQQKIEEEAPDLILLDVMMPEMDGYTLCRWLKSNEATRLIPVIMVTALDRTADKVRAFESDADDFLSKPVNRHELIARVRSCLRIKTLNDRLECSESVLFALAHAVEAKDPYTIGHSRRVSAFAADLAQMTGFPPEKVVEIEKGGLLHDVGKIGIPDAILRKPGPLTPDERKVIERHPVIGEEICKSLKSFGCVLPLIRSHHELLDGSGYPDGLCGDAISMEIRVMTVADIYDALSSARPYRGAMPLDKVKSILTEFVDNGQLDRDLTKIAFERITVWEELALSACKVSPPEVALATA